MSGAGCDISDKVKRLLRRAAKNLFDSGITDGDRIIDRIHDDLKDHSPMSRSQIADAISGYGVKRARRADVENHFADLQREYRDLSRTQDLLNGNINSNEAKNTRAQSVLRNRIADLQRRIEYRDFNKPEKSTPEYDEQTKALRAEHDALQKQLRNDEPAPGAHLPADPSVKYNERRMKALDEQMKAVQERLNKGDFEPDETRAPFNYKVSPELYQKIKERDALVRKYENAKYAARQKNQSWAGRFSDFGFRLYRAVILSSMNVIGKLGAAATLRILGEPLERIVGSGLRLVPGLRDVYAKSSLYREGFVPGVEGESMRKLFSKDTLAEMQSQLKNGQDFIDAYLGNKDYGGPRGKLEYVGQLHSALREPAKLKTFYASLMYRRESRIQDLMHSEGISRDAAIERVNQPQEHDALFAKAAGDAYAAIFQNDNLAVGVYRQMIARMMNAGEEGSTTRAYGRATARAMEFSLPIVKVPTNLVAEGGSYLGGGLKALVPIITKKGIKNLTADQADYVARNLQKQLIGGGLVALGALFYKNFGGYYQPGDNKANREIEPDAAKFGDTSIPRFLFHTPAAQMLQLGATYARVYNEDRHNNQRNTVEKGINAGMRAFGGLMEQVPFVPAMGHLGEDFKNVEAAEHTVGKMAGRFVPPDVARLAKSMDNNRKVKPRGAVDEVKARLPWLRSEVPSG